MKLKRPNSTTQNEPIIALVDVIFFLLVFFMLVARLDATAPFEVQPPIALSGSDMPGGGVTISISQDGEIALDGQVVSREHWFERLVEKTRHSPVELVRVNAHAAVSLRHVLPVLSKLEDAALAEVVVVVTPDRL